MKKYLVGGAVRDFLLKIPIKERDWLIIGSSPKEMLDIGYQQVGKEFPVFLHPQNHEEYALARTEKKHGRGYAGFICQTSPKITLEEDLYRRDLTINAIARDEQGNIIDPYNGQKDIKLRILRHVSNLFQEDPLRILRVARFAAQFAHLNFRIAPETLNLMKKMIYELPSLSPERIWIETKKSLSTKNPQIYFTVLKNCGALKIVFPEIQDLFNNKIVSPNNNEPENNIGVIALSTLKIAANLTNNIAVRFATICKDLGENKEQIKGYKNKIHKETIGTKIIDNLCKRLKIPNFLCNTAKIINKYHKQIDDIHLETPDKIIKLFDEIDVWRHPERLEHMLLAKEANFRTSNKFKNQPYLSKKFLYQAYSITRHINVSEIIKKGIKGKEIKKEIFNQRQKKIFKWKKLNNKYKHLYPQFKNN
ncbi:multifunctional CCA addition/repair protein [Blochmannia endosymbiont of Colobopsis nipponica]|uniref:multifunctional CCA addition/repair protein n=1 Tax=Blochmannia endosymbiont of Colobopsis nipponica TaxID=2681987 RepID=UPI00177ABB2F|nr:multifunctional CCA addition/repair protein [Blochmannia endosymbiont of Colobopsis nipponica]QOI10787.1 multifunctional CCA addition/repair protein [Blochmannia endosymbiont of Colobopsis nipponica]